MYQPIRGREKKKSASVVDKSAGAVAAYFQEFATEQIPDDGSDNDGLSAPLGMSLSRFCRFIAHGRLLGPDLDHSHVLEVFKEAAGGNPKGILDAVAFRAALQGVAVRLHSRQLLGNIHAVREPSVQALALEELLRDVDQARENVFDPSLTASQLEGVLFDAEVIEVAYSYAKDITVLFEQFSREKQQGSQQTQGGRQNLDNPCRTVSCRAACQSCCSVGLVPGCVVAGELADVAHELAVIKHGGMPSGATKRYFANERMQEGRWKTAGGKNSWEVLETIDGEPCYNYPEFVELLVTTVLYMPPRMHLEKEDVRAARVREVFERYLTPRVKVIKEPSLEEAVEGQASKVGSTDASGQKCQQILRELEMLLPALPPPQEYPNLPHPISSTPLQAQPPEPESSEEFSHQQNPRRLQQRPQQKLQQVGRRKEEMWTASIYAEKRAARSKALRLARRLGQKSGKTPVSWTGKVRWLSHPGATTMPVPTPSVHLQSCPRQVLGAGFDIVSGTPVLRMALIDEPLRAPLCDCSNKIVADEVIGLIEAALTSRRLRRYDAARALLLQAHSLWTKLTIDTEFDTNEAMHASSNAAGSSWASVLHHLDTGDLAEDLLPADVGLFFFCELASLSSAMGDDGAALQLLWRARHYSNRLLSSHPDTAVVWGGLGRTAFRMGYFEVAAQAAHRARCIREATVGEDTVEAATAYNNVACCFAALQRPLEAAAYLELAAELLRVLAGDEHPRTQTVLRNLHQARVTRKDLHMDPPPLFSYRVKATKERRRRSKRGGRYDSQTAASKGSSRSESRESHGSKGSRRSRRGHRRRPKSASSRSSRGGRPSSRGSRPVSASRRGSRTSRPPSARSRGSRMSRPQSANSRGSQTSRPPSATGGNSRYAPQSSHRRYGRSISPKMRALGKIVARGKSRQKHVL